MNWDIETQDKLKLMISKTPVFHRHITEEAVIKRAEENARSRKVPLVEESDVIAAFFTDVPSPFYSMMIRLLDQSGFDYKKYGFPRKSS
ncbi:MAG: hypothetical protein PHC33_05160 [Candidatus Omnitrophica bacterium]|nr:hypothetical protein [Candidatus Omnitrophota bacterium]